MAKRSEDNLTTILKEILSENDINVEVYSSILHNIYNYLKENEKFITISPRFDCLECDLRHFKTKTNLNCFIQHKSKSNTNQLKEEWIGSLITNSLNIEHVKIKKANFKIPLSSIKRGLRTTSNIRCIDVNDKLDYLIVHSFKDLKENYLRYILEKKTINKFKAEEFNIVLNNFEKRKSFLHLNRRLYLASPGTSYVAFHSNTPFIGVDTWGFYTMNKDEAKLIALWLNSTFGIIQLLMIGVAIEGNWMKVHKYMLKDLYIPEPTLFLKNNSDELYILYKKVSKIEVLSLTEQLQITHNIRQEIDRFFIEKLELDIWKDYGTLNKFLKTIQKELLKELKGLCPSDF
ncbi:hypothetical protein LCGC14_1516790 [marine sediment metagenome]|uniref:Uncharacterized protein n=1 Tax=marine sediment metagenome TaxID=412755 RepID=A0A0F9IZV3_9ZZZZ